MREHALSHEKIIVITPVIPHNRVHPFFNIMSFVFVLEKLFLSQQYGCYVHNGGCDSQLQRV